MLNQAANTDPYSAGNAPLVELKNVCLSLQKNRRVFGSGYQTVLDSISLQLHPGETLGIIGRNGAGKSSLLKLIAGIISPDSGTIYRRTDKITLLSYQLGFNPLLSGRENAVHTAMLQGMSEKHIASSMDEIIKFSGLENAIDDKLATYSAGMRSRLGFSVSLQLDPDILLVDEALGVGDHEFKERSSRAMRERLRSKKTIVFVSHDPFTVKALCDRAVWIENSCIVMQDIPEQVIQSYHNFDRVVSDLATNMGSTETRVRAAPAHKNPLKAMQKLRAALRSEKRKLRSEYFDATGAGEQAGIGVCVPSKHPRLSNLLEEDCGRWCWIEDTRQISRGDPHTVIAAYEQFNRLILKLSMELKLNPAKIRDSDIYRQLVKLLKHL